jgi:hypothetical protein
MFDSENGSEWSTRKNGSKINEVQDGSASLLDSQGIYGKRFVGGKNFEHSLFRSITRRHLLGILPLQGTGAALSGMGSVNTMLYTPRPAPFKERLKV